MTSEQDKPHIHPSETESSEEQSGDPGRTPGKAEGEDDETIAEGKTVEERENSKSE